MGLLKILRKIKRKEKEMRLLILGLDNAGKTTIVKALMGGDVHSVSPTLGFTIESFEYGLYKLNIWDVGGQQTIRSYWRNYYERTDGIVFVVDSGDRTRLQEVKSELHNLLRAEKLAAASLLVFANKSDIPDAMSVGEIDRAIDLKSLSLDDNGNISRHCHIVRCSAMDRTGLETGIEWIVNDIAQRIYLMD